MDKEKKQTAEDFLNESLPYQSYQGKNGIAYTTISRFDPERVKKDAIKYGNMRVQETLNTLMDEDAIGYLKCQSYDLGQTACPYDFGNGDTVSLSAAKHALSIQAAKHQKEMEELKEKAIAAFKKAEEYSWNNDYDMCDPSAFGVFKKRIRRMNLSDMRLYDEWNEKEREKKNESRKRRIEQEANTERKLLEKASIHKRIDSYEFVDIILPFGKYKNKTIQDVFVENPHYLGWCNNQKILLFTDSARNMIQNRVNKLNNDNRRS